MDSGFIDVLKQLVAEQGNAALIDAQKCKALLADYTKNEYKKESRLLLQAVGAGVAKMIEGADDLEPCKKAQIRELEEDHALSPVFAADVVNTLALVLRGDTTVTVSPSAEKAAERAAAEKAEAEKAEAEKAAADKAASESRAKAEAAAKAAAESQAKAEAAKAAADRAATENAAAERAAAERAAAKAAADRVAAERAAEKAAADRAAAERAARNSSSSSHSYSSRSYRGGTRIFAIVDRDSEMGSTFIFGVIFAAIGLGVGSLIGGWIAIGVGGVVGWVIGSQVIGKSIYVNLLAIIFGVACGVLIAFLAGWVGNGLRPDLAPTIARTLFIPSAIVGTVLFLIARSKGITALLVVLVIFGIGGGITLTEPPFPSSLSRGITTVAQTINTNIATTTATVTSGSANFRSAPSTSGNIIKTLQKGDILTVTGDTENGWVPVRHGIDSGYVSADLISIGETTAGGGQTASVPAASSPAPAAPAPTTAAPAQQEQAASPLGDIAEWARGSYPDNVVLSANSITNGRNINITGARTVVQPPLSGHPNLKWAYVYVGDKKYGVVWDRTTYANSGHNGIELGLGSYARSAFDFYSGSDKDSIFKDIAGEAPAIKVVK